MLPIAQVLTNSSASFEAKPSTVGSPVPALRNLREGRGTAIVVASAIQKARPPAPRNVPQSLRVDLVTSEFYPREIPPPAGENAGVRDDAGRW
jgi:hypothetical protein